MQFNSFVFVAFFAVVFAGALLLRRRVAARNLWLLVASYVFYGCWDWRFLSLIWISTLVDYCCGLALNVDRPDPEHPPPPNLRRRLILLASLVTNLGLLGFFKYYDFFIDSAVDALARFDIHVHPARLNIILPVGISFYTFQTLSYTIDLYRGRIATERNLLNFALFVAFFPQLVAGPIERASHLLPQMRKVLPVTSWHLHTGFYLICWGMFKKVVLADNVAIIADGVFGAEHPKGLTALLGIYAFAIQIYCDFSAYSDIARGTARCMGFDLMLNFNLPYFAVNPSDFWRRWHISLSSWLRDYLYIPLGGNRHGTLRTYFNLMATMLLGGLWHGAAWTFVVWGAYHGILLCAHRVVQPLLERWFSFKNAAAAAIWKTACVIAFFHIVCGSWLIFRAESIHQIWSMTTAIFTDFGPLDWDVVINVKRVIVVAACGVLLAAVQLVQWFSKDLMVVFRLPIAARMFVYAFFILLFVLFGEYGEIPFIYFQF
ncbi:MAG: MBOAT family protein [Planctomycetota bacterium]|nr:MAG: MBOAT family protein [Planctomycetota bacterium]